MDTFVMHHWKALLLAAWLFSNMVSTMPSPKEANAGVFYGWIFNFLHVTVGSAGRVIGTTYPQFNKFLSNGKAEIDKEEK